METKEFFRKLLSRYLWLNLLAMVLLVVVLALGVHIALNLYTHHGETVSVPDVRKQSLEAAVDAMEAKGLVVEVNDTGYVKNLPPGTVLEQMPSADTRVKTGRVIYLTINATNSPTLALPDIIDNSSLREAQARLTALGFKLGEPKYIPGEKDWVYGVQVNGRGVTKGQRIPIDAKVIILVGNGQVSNEEDLVITDAPESEFDDLELVEGEGTEEETLQRGATGKASPDDVDDFEVVE